MLTSNHVIFMEYKNSDLFQGFLFKFWSLMELNVLWKKRVFSCGLLVCVDSFLASVCDWCYCGTYNVPSACCKLSAIKIYGMKTECYPCAEVFFFKIRCWEMSSVSTSFYYCSHFSEKVIFWIKTNSSQSESMWTVDALLTATTVTSSIQRSILKRSKSKLRLRPSF